MTRIITAEPLTREAFAPFGDVIEVSDAARHYPINGGMTERYHDLAKVEALGPNARVLVSIFRGQPYPMPLKLSMVERHPFGSQAFMPLGGRPFLVIVCPEGEEGPEAPRAFLTAPGQGVNYPRNHWHGVLVTLGEEQDFLVVDRGGDGNNVEEFHFETPWEIRMPETL